MSVRSLPTYEAKAPRSHSGSVRGASLDNEHRSLQVQCVLLLKCVRLQECVSALTNMDEQRWIQQLQSEWDFVIIREMIDEKRASVLGTHAEKVLYTVS
jgi:hypothetical protein